MSKYYKLKSKYMRGGEKAEMPPGGFNLKPIPEKHNSLSAALQSNLDETQEAAEIQQEINQRGGGYVAPGESPPGMIEVEGSTTMDKGGNSVLTGIREMQMQAQVDTHNDGKPGTIRPEPKKGGAKRRRKKNKKSKRKGKRWPPKRRSRKKRKGGQQKLVHIGSPKATSSTKEAIAQKHYKHLIPIKQYAAWNPRNPKFGPVQKAIQLPYRHHFTRGRYGGKRKSKKKLRKTTRKRKRRKKRTRRKR